MKLNGVFVVKQIAGTYYAVPTGKTATQMKCMIKLNETAAFLFEKAQDGADEDALVRTLIEKFGIEENTARADVFDFISTLKGANILE